MNLWDGELKGYEQKIAIVKFHYCHNSQDCGVQRDTGMRPLQTHQQALRVSFDRCFSESVERDANVLCLNEVHLLTSTFI